MPTRLRSLPVCLGLFALLCPLCPAADGATNDSPGNESLGIRAPEGFEVSLYADDSLAHDIYSLTIDARGRVVVAGANYVKILEDTDADGRADKATLFSKLPASGAHGMYFDGPDLICTGDNSVMRLRDADNDSVADGPGEVWTALRHPEHGANGIVRGPDGCYYLICGNDAGISPKHAVSPTSPVKFPRSGGVVRFSPDGRPRDVYAHGFRNPYDLDFDAAGHLLTVDSDGERDHHLPWYAPTRLFDVAQGGEHGWLLSGWVRGWNRPASFYDNIERIVEIGRGSPTGVASYRHRQFPEHYRGGVFSACWTLGRIYYFPLAVDGASCASQTEIFLQTTGDVGFAPCDLAVGPQGDLFVAIGGRRTLGSVFRVRWTKDKPAAATKGRELDQVLLADQPLSSWSRANWVPLAKALGAAPFEQALDDTTLDPPQRVRAIEVLVEVFSGIDGERAAKRVNDPSPEVRARLAWALGCGAVSPQAIETLCRLTGDADPRVQRAAWEALAMAETIDPASRTSPDWQRGLTSPVRRVRVAALNMARDRGRASHDNFRKHASAETNNTALKLAGLWLKQTDDASGRSVSFTAEDGATCAAVVVDTRASTAQRLEAVRLLQLGLGDLRVSEGQPEVYAGYSGNAAAALSPSDASRQKLAKQLSAAFPSPDAELNRELGRLLGMLGSADENFRRAVSRQWTADSTVEDDLHYLIIASMLPGTRSRELTAAVATSLLKLHRKLDALEQYPSRNWPQRVGEVFDQLCQRDPALAAALVASPDFGHVEHALFVEKLPGDAAVAAIRKLWKAALDARDVPTPELIALSRRLPVEEGTALVRSQWDEPGLRDAITLVLARNPDPEDRSRFLESLASAQPGVIEVAAKALVKLGMDCTSLEMVAALKALKQACGNPTQPQPRKSILALLNFWTEENSDVDEDPDPSKVYIGWFQMFENYYPAHAKLLKQSTSTDAEGWRKRLAAADWSTGDPGRGRVVFERRACHRCHQQSGHLGPELKGAVSRMSRDDLFTAILDPNLEVAPAFQVSVIATKAGQVYHGLVVYESPEGTLLQTGPDTTVRVTGAEQSSLRKSSQSLMPTGLLDTLSDAELSDLYAYLKTLAAK